MGGRVEGKCPEGESWSKVDNEWGCFVLPLGRKKEMAIGFDRGDCPEGFLKVEDRVFDYFCIPCETVKYTCPDSGAAILERCLSVPEERYGADVMSKEEASRKVAEAVRDLLGKNCQIHSKGFFFNEFEKWKSQLTRTAEYRCITKLPYREEATVTREISVSLVIGEAEETTYTRLEEAAKKQSQAVAGCLEVEFRGFQARDGEVKKSELEKAAKEDSLFARELRERAYRLLDECARKYGPSKCWR